MNSKIYEEVSKIHELLNGLAKRAMLEYDIDTLSQIENASDSLDNIVKIMEEQA